MNDTEFLYWFILVISILWLVCELFGDTTYPDWDDQ